MSRPATLRSVFLGNPRYLSAYGLGVQQAMGLLGHWHRNLSFWDEEATIDKQMSEMRPHVIFTHMALWPPDGALTAAQIATILGKQKRRGASVYLHDGDPRTDRVLPPDIDVASVFCVALVNRALDNLPWKIPSINWPYAAMVQKAIAPPVEEWKADLHFAGLLRRDGGDLYGRRTELVMELWQRLGAKMRIVSPGGGDVNNRFLVADVAPSANAILGFGRPDVAGWLDTRVTQWPGAGGVLIHDDANKILEPDVHFLQCESGPQAVESILRCVERARTEGPAIRERAFRHVQKHHTWLQRIEAALAAAGVG